MQKRIVLIGLTTLLIAGCVSMRPATQVAHNKKQSAQQVEYSLADITHWNLRGAVAIRDQQKALTASVNWQQYAGKRYKLILMGPFSAGATQLTGRPGQVVLQQTSNKTYSAGSPEQLMQQQLGWSIPVSNMYYWVRGIPAPGLSSGKRYDRYGHLIALQQQGWSVNYLRYTGVGPYDLPSKIFMKNNNITVKLVISSWRL